MNDTYEHLEEQEEAHLAWTIEQQKWWRNSIRQAEIGRNIFVWGFGIVGLFLLFWFSYPANIAASFCCVLAAACMSMLWESLVESAQSGLLYMIECQQRSEKSLEDIRRLKREWRGY